jgi:hypothetical protein
MPNESRCHESGAFVSTFGCPEWTIRCFSIFVMKNLAHSHRMFKAADRSCDWKVQTILARLDGGHEPKPSRGESQKWRQRRLNFL